MWMRLGAATMDDMTDTGVVAVPGRCTRPALPDRLRVTGAVDLFAASRVGDGGGPREWPGPAGRRRGGFWPLGEGKWQRLFLVLWLLARPRQVIVGALPQGPGPAARRAVWAAVRRRHHGGVTRPQALGMGA
jgi:hypothetical protein